VRDVIVAGGGPAGLAVAAEAARRGLDVLLLERRALPADKACGEGLLPGALSALADVGALRHLDSEGSFPFRAIRWISEDGTEARAELPAPHGLGVRRLSLSAALLARARELGAEVRDRTALEGHRVEEDAVVAFPGGGEEVRARLLIAADGLASPVRERAGLGLPAAGPRRFGVRRHFALPPWTDSVEVHFSPGAEAYVTPVGPRRVGVAFLFEEGVRPGYPALLARFPRLAGRLGAAPFDSALAGAGPLLRRASSRVQGRLVLAGDAGGYVDALTGEGLSLALESACSLGEALPEALARGAGAGSLRAWEREVASRYRRSAAFARLALALARRPVLRRGAVAALSRSPRLFSHLVALAVGEGPPRRSGHWSAVRG